MRNRGRVGVALLLTFAFTSAYAYQPKVEIVETFENSRVVAFVDPADLENYPAWSPEQDAQPPVSIREAIGRFQQRSTKNKTNPGNIKEIELKELPGYQHHWHYLIKTKSMRDGKLKSHVYVILMSGKVIPAMVEPESYK